MEKAVCSKSGCFFHIHKDGGRIVDGEKTNHGFPAWRRSEQLDVAGAD